MNQCRAVRIDPREMRQGPAAPVIYGDLLFPADRGWHWTPLLLGGIKQCFALSPGRVLTPYNETVILHFFTMSSITTGASQ